VPLGSVPSKKYSYFLPPPQYAILRTSVAGYTKSCLGTSANAAFMKRAQVRAGMLPPYDSRIGV